MFCMHAGCCTVPYLHVHKRLDLANVAPGVPPHHRRDAGNGRGNGPQKLLALVGYGFLLQALFVPRARFSPLTAAIPDKTKQTKKERQEEKRCQVASPKTTEEGTRQMQRRTSTSRFSAYEAIDNFKTLTRCPSLHEARGTKLLAPATSRDLQ